MLDTEITKVFFRVIFLSRGYVYSQRINIDSKELRKLTELINENLRPENIKYRYDFFYDDCSNQN